MNLYIDVDGVLLTKYQEPVPGVREFLEFVTENHTGYWLTSHSKDGTNERVIEVLSKVYGEDVLELARKILPSAWHTFKTEAIDFTRDFRWVDDYLMLYEETVLRKADSLEKIIIIDLDKNPEQLKHLKI